MIKLFVWHKLRCHPSIKLYGSLAKLEVKCLHAAFDEMIADGYADDGLFPKMKEFFLSLTISEKELNFERTSNERIRHVRLTRIKQLDQDIKRYEKDFNEKKNDEKNCEEKIHQINRQIKYLEEKVDEVIENWKLSKNKKKKQKQQEDFQQYYENCRINKSNYRQQLQELQQTKDSIEKEIIDRENKIRETNQRKEAIVKELDTRHQSVDKQLVKPPRGLIMYGPPGTGKSDILKKLAKKLGILMVGPSLAAGELNRSHVGESERIITALCTRARQVPYAMCCISIDEIDSLAPKRNENSSEGKVDKISVLLSLIEGIKDVPNLMILSATNRLHMMDEAFLRRMTGKFFVGRPSSNARLRILQKIPCWAIEPELLSRLSNATTNFSGAAVK